MRKIIISKVCVWLSIVISTTAVQAATVYTSVWVDNFGSSGTMYYVDAGSSAFADGIYFDLQGDAPVDPFDFLVSSTVAVAMAHEFDVGMHAAGSTLGTALGGPDRNVIFYLDQVDGPVVQEFTNRLNAFAELSCNDDVCNVTGLLYSDVSNDLIEFLEYGVFAEVATNEGNLVPIPTAAWLFGSGLLGLVGAARRRVCS